jgi:transcription elongation factor SPT4
VARWQRLDKYVPGVYATKVVGTLPEEILSQLEDNGVQYYPRDGSGVEQEEV